MHITACLDIGTNSILLLIAGTGQDGQIQVILDESRITRLGKGVDKTGILAPDAIERSIEAIKEFAEKANAAGAEKIVSVGTSALRDAQNSHDFLGPAEEILKGPVQVISGEQEAELSWLSVVADTSLDVMTPLLVADVGGGSTEIIAGSHSQPSFMTSIDIGAVRLTERLLTNDPPAPEQVQQSRQLAVKSLEPVLSSLEIKSAAGIGGTVVNLAAILEKGAAHTEIHGRSISRSEITELINDIGQKTVEERRAIPGLEPARADVIVGGAVIFESILKCLNLEKITVSNRGARFGLAYMAADSIKEVPRD